MNNSTFLSHRNSTYSSAHWTFSAITEAVIFPIVLLLNGSVLVIFVTQKLLHQPFHIYLANLLVGNILFTILNNPLDIYLQIYYPKWNLGPVACFIYQYSLYVAAGIMVNGHLLIVVNRIWAVTFPFSYSQDASIKTALIACLVHWALIHAVSLPYILLDALLYRVSTAAPECFFNFDALPVYSITVQIVCFCLPNVLIILVYPYLAFKRRRFVVMASVANRNRTRNEQHLQNQSTDRRRRTQRDSRQGFLVLTALTVSIALLYTPENAFFLIRSFIDFRAPVVGQVVIMLFALQPILDPIYFALVLPDLRQFIESVFRGPRRQLPVIRDSQPDSTTTRPTALQTLGSAICS